MNHRSLSDYYEQRFANQEAGPPPSPSQTEQLADDWLGRHVKAGNMRRCFDEKHGEHYVWIGAGPAPTPDDIPCDRVSPDLQAERRKAALLTAARDAVLSDLIGRMWRATLTEAQFHRFCDEQVEQFVRGADNSPERQNPQPDPPAGHTTK